MLEPFAKCLATSNDFRLRKEIFEHVFTYLIRQSDEALEYEAEGIEKQAIVSMSQSYNNWKKPRKGKSKTNDQANPDENEDEESDPEPAEIEDEANEIENEEVDDENEVEGDEENVVGDDGDDDMEIEESNFDWGAKDPRAGGVDAVIPQMKPNYSHLADFLFKIASDKSVRSKNRKALHDLVKKYV